MEREKAIALFTQLSSMEYEVPADPGGSEEEPFVSGFKEPSYEVKLTAQLVERSTPARRDWSVDVRFSSSVFRPDGTGQLRALLDIGDEAGVDVGLPDLSRATFS